MKRLLVTIIICLALIGSPLGSAEAHPGELDSNGDYQLIKSGWSVVAAGAGSPGIIESDILRTDTGEQWNVINGTWARDTAGLYLAANSGRRSLSVNSGVADGVIEADIKWYDKCGFLVRFDRKAVSPKAFLVVVNNGGSYISLLDLGTWTETVVTSNTGTVLAAGQTYHVETVLNGTSIKVYLDGVEILSTTQSTNQNATYHGLHANTHNCSNRWDNFTISSEEGSGGINVLRSLWELESNDGKIAFSDVYYREGSVSLRMELNSTDPIISGNSRCELAVKDIEQPLEEHWYMFSTYLPDGGPEDYVLDPNSGESIAQWHQYRDVGDAQVPAPLTLMTKNGRYCLNITYCPDAIVTSENYTKIGFDLGSYLEDKGKWTDWEFHVKWGWLDEHNPICEVFKDGELIFKRSGPNVLNDQHGVYQKLGPYKWDWYEHPERSYITKRVIYYDRYLDYKKLEGSPDSDAE